MCRTQDYCTAWTTPLRPWLSTSHKRVALIKDVGGVGTRPRDPRWCEGVVPMQPGDQSAATPGSGSLLRASAAVELPELPAAGFGAAGAQAQRLRGRRWSRTPCAPRTPLHLLPCVSVPILSRRSCKPCKWTCEALGREKRLREEGRRWEVGR